MQEALAEEEAVGTPSRRLSYLDQQLDVVKAFQDAGLLRTDMTARHLLTLILAITSFPACFTKVASASLAADDQAALEKSWSDCLEKIAEVLSPEPRPTESSGSQSPH
jgi:hypothetical protein